MRAILTNTSPLPREHWAVVTFPRPLAAPFGPECSFVCSNGQRFRAVRGRTVGMRTTYRVRAYMGGSQTLEGSLVNEAQPEPYVPHRWVTDDIGALIPSLGARIPGLGDFWDVPLGAPVLLDQSPAHTRWGVRRLLPQAGIIFEWWADVLHNDPVIPVWGKAVWSDRHDTATNKSFEFLAMKSGEYIALDFIRRHAGGSVPMKDAHGIWVQILNTSPVILNDGSGLPFSGSMLAFVSPRATDKAADPEDWSDDTVRSINNLRAAPGGPIVGVCLEWDTHWLAGRNLPRFRPGYQSQHEQVWQQFLDSLDIPAGWFANRPVGIGKTPGQTGDQEDFGATKGTYAVCDGDARFIRVMQYAVQAELFRGFNHYENNGPLDINAHPLWVTWNGVTHYHSGVSPDSIGKTRDGAAPGTGWYGYDDEHRSQNTLAAYMMLTDDPLMEDQLRHLVTTDRASYRMRFPNNGSGAARGQGRTSGAWAQFVGLTEGVEQQHWVNIIASRMNASLNLNPSINVAGPMKVLASGGPDSRKQVYRPDGSLGPWVSFWEHGLAAVGIYNAVKAQPNNADAHEILVRICRTLATFACFEENGEWWTVADCLWSEGEAPPGGLVSTSRALVCDRNFASGVTSWTFAGLLVAREFLAQQAETDPALLNKLSRYINAITGGQEAGDRRQAEWWATVQSVQFPV